MGLVIQWVLVHRTSNWIHRTFDLIQKTFVLIRKISTLSILHHYLKISIPYFHRTSIQTLRILIQYQRIFNQILGTSIHFHRSFNHSQLWGQEHPRFLVSVELMRLYVDLPCIGGQDFSILNSTPLKWLYHHHQHPFS